MEKGEGWGGGVEDRGKRVRVWVGKERKGNEMEKTERKRNFKNYYRIYTL